MTRYEGKPFVILGVKIDSSEDETAAAEYDRAIGTRSWADAACVGGFASERWGVRYRHPDLGVRYNFPREYLIDAKGVVRHRYFHDNHVPLHPLDLMPAIDELLAEIK